MKLIITIDTEEDNWGSYSPTEYTLENIEKIPYIQDLFDYYNLKPTYLITYPVATDERAISILKKILKENRCEIGSHCHPWNTPPFEEENTIQNSMLCNLPFNLQYRKLNSLNNITIKNFQYIPLSFRAGRWGFNQDVAKNLYRLGYRIDTSITPFIDWRYCYGPNFSDILPNPFRFTLEKGFKESANGFLIEIPVTIGFLRQKFTISNHIRKIIKRGFLRKLRLAGILSRLGLLNLTWLSPEPSNTNDMIMLTKIMMKMNYKFINMTFHSCSLKSGFSPFVRTKQDEVQFFQRIKEFLEFTRKMGIESIKLSDAIKLMQ